VNVFYEIALAQPARRGIAHVSPLAILEEID